MTKAEAYRGLTVGIAALMAAFFGFASAASAQVASIVNTGPGSNNTVSSSNNTNCDVSNSNNLFANNFSNQVAVTGDATASNNTNVGSGWGAYDPAVWQAQGYSYAQWHSAVSGYIASQQSSWGNLSGGGGGVHTGNASNSNSANFNFNVDNSNAADVCLPGQGGDGNGDGTIDETGPDSTNRINNNVSHDVDLANLNNLGANNFANQFGMSGDAGAFNNTNVGGGLGSGQAANVNQTGVNGKVSNGGGIGGGGAGGGGAGGGPKSSISNTGPDSRNVISNNKTSNTRVTNNNNLGANNHTGQSSSSGSSTANNNTNAGGGGSGSSSNSNSANTSLSVNN